MLLARENRRVSSLIAAGGAKRPPAAMRDEKRLFSQAMMLRGEGWLLEGCRERWPKMWVDSEQKVNQQTACLHCNYSSKKSITKKIIYLSNLALFNWSKEA